jgi:serine phosphatase RsbU (regulator of sigma subunit)
VQAAETTAGATDDAAAPTRARAPRRLTLGARMIVGTTALVVVVVIGLGLTQLLVLQRVHDRTTRDTKRLLATQFETQLARVGESTIRLLAGACRTFIESSDDGNLRAYLVETRRRSPELTFAYVLDDRERLIAHSDPARNPVQGHAAFDEPSWGAVKRAWGGHVARGEAPTALRDGGVALFAMPILPAAVPGAAPSGNPDEEPYGYLVIGLGLAELERAQATAELQTRRARDEASRDTLLATLGLGALFVLAASAVAVWQSVRIARPIRGLARTATRIARGELDARAVDGGSEEIQKLADSFNDMAVQLQGLLAQAADRAKLDKELEVAHAIQHAMVPSAAIIDAPGLQLAGHFEPASQCGGDWWSAHRLDDSHVLVIIGDVTGHGVPAALLTAAAKAACDVTRDTASGPIMPARLLGAMNRAIWAAAGGALVMTCFAAVYDASSRTMRFANAGHEFPYLLRGGGGKLTALVARGVPLGSEEVATFDERVSEMSSGDVVVWYTDGIVECESPTAERFGDRRLRQAIEAAGTAAPEAVREHIVSTAHRFYGNEPHRDDVTLVVGRIS